MNQGEPKDQMNWVERRAQTQSTLYKKAPELWNEVRNELQAACESFVKHYCPNPNVKELVWHLQGTNCLRIIRTLYRDNVRVFNDTTVELLVCFEPGPPPIIAVARNGGKRNYEIRADLKDVFLSNGVTIEQLSQDALEPLLFREGENRTPIFPAIPA